MTHIISMGEIILDMVSCDAGSSWLDVDCFRKRFGGAPANVAVNLARLGTSSIMWGAVGDDHFGNFLRQKFKSYNVITDYIQIAEQFRTTVAYINLDQYKQPTFLFFRNPGADMFFSITEREKALLDETAILNVGTFSLSMEPFRSAQFEALRVARQKGVVISADINIRSDIWSDQQELLQFAKALIIEADIVKCNQDELELLANTRDPVLGTHLLRQRDDQLIIITLREHGCFYLFQNGTGYVPGSYVDFVNGVGTGDGFVAGMLHYISAMLQGQKLNQLTNKNVYEVLRNANAVGAIVAASDNAVPIELNSQEVLAVVANKHLKSRKTPKWLILFDIDGTLVGNLSTSKDANVFAVNAVLGSEVRTGEHIFDGKTDPQNLQSLMRLAGLGDDEVKAKVDAVVRTYVQRVDSLFSELVEIEVLPGVRDLLKYLSLRNDVVLGLLTGNLRDTAEIKLKKAGIWHYFQLGAYGSDNADRYQLPSVAGERFEEKYNFTISPDYVIIIGDTIHDIGCAKAFGATSVAVPTGVISQDTLAKAQPTLLINDLTEVHRLLSVMTEVQ